jgi:hypothetical protein
VVLAQERGGVWAIPAYRSAPGAAGLTGAAGRHWVTGTTPGRDQGQAAEQGGDLGVAARSDAAGHAAVVSLDGGADLVGGEVGGQMGDHQVGAGS